MAAVPQQQKLQPVLKNSEHVSLESDVSETRVKPNMVATLASFELRQPSRGTVTEISILKDHYVAAITRRRKSVRSHNVDLRFVDPKPIGYRRIAERWFYVALALTALTAISILSSVYLHFALLTQYGTPTSVALGTATICCFLMCYYFTTETLVFVTLHGRAPAIGVVGDLGMLKKAKPIAAEVAKRVALARLHFKQSKASHLRDEMREHTRLFEQGALTEKQYEEAKMRVLRSHD